MKEFKITEDQGKHLLNLLGEVKSKYVFPIQNLLNSLQPIMPEPKEKPEVTPKVVKPVVPGK